MGKRLVSLIQLLSVAGRCRCLPDHFSLVLSVKPATCVSELAEFYRDSCRRHKAQPIETIMKHLDTLDLNSNSRRPVLSLREQNLTAESCEALEEVLKRVSHVYTWDHVHLSVIIHAKTAADNTSQQYISVVEKFSP